MEPKVMQVGSVQRISFSIGWLGILPYPDKMVWKIIFCKRNRQIHPWQFPQNMSCKNISNLLEKRSHDATRGPTLLSLFDQPPKPALFLLGNSQKIGSNARGVFWWLIFKRWADGKTSLPQQNGLKNSYLQTKSPNSPMAVPQNMSCKNIFVGKKISRIYEIYDSYYYASFFRSSLHGINHPSQFWVSATIPSITRPRSCSWSSS